MMITPELWKLCVLKTAHLYLSGADTEDIRKIVKHLNVLLNTGDVIFQPDISRAVAVLECITLSVNATLDHHDISDRISNETRLQLVQFQLQSFRQP
jgi:hypothetical protein